MLEYATVHYRSITGRGASHILAWGWWEGVELLALICYNMILYDGIL